MDSVVIYDNGSIASTVQSTTRKSSQVLVQISNKKAYMSTFNEVLLEKWNNAHSNGICRYKLKIKCKRLPGKLNFIIQSNSQRVQNRRTPETFSSVSMPFNKDKFNFTRLSPEEILFKVAQGSVNSHSSSEYLSNYQSDDFAVINVSPFAVGHTLLVPDLSQCRPQILNGYAVKLAIHVHCLSQNSNFIIGFNSMCGQASVNHLHLHFCYLNIDGDEFADGLSDSRLLIQQPLTASKQLSERCYLCEATPLPSFLFQVAFVEEIGPVADDVAVIVSYFVKENIAHNMSIVRAPPVNLGHYESSEKEQCLVLRVFLWPRKLSFTRKTGEVNTGAFELSGHALVPEEQFDTISEEELLLRIKSVAIPDVTCNEIVTQVSQLLNNQID
ncbi:GDP-D-glucose phosphorylase 1-like [Clavelina lepadiformis]|uniref:GDP-D-glucose phosphorylase 1-like n=1 Tax=Clavelina lepadiformis TaxID=159417 RepID=UPI004041E19F